jgi:hypothetical protein
MFSMNNNFTHELSQVLWVLAMLFTLGGIIVGIIALFHKEYLISTYFFVGSLVFVVFVRLHLEMLCSISEIANRSKK